MNVLFFVVVFCPVSDNPVSADLSSLADIL